MEKDYFTLEQVARVIQPERDGQPLPMTDAIKEVLAIIFAGSPQIYYAYERGDCTREAMIDSAWKNKSLIPSCFIKSKRMYLYEEIITKQERKNGEWPLTVRVVPGLCLRHAQSKPHYTCCSVVKETVSKARMAIRSKPFHVLFDGMVDVFMDFRSRNTGSSSGKIQLKPDAGYVDGGSFLERRHTSLTWGLPERRIQCQLLEPAEVAESSLYVRQFWLESYIENDTEARNRLEQLVSNGVNAAMPEYLPPYLDPKHNHYAPELAALVEVWLELYEDGKHKERVAHKPQIAALLKEKGLSPTAIKDITRVAIPKKRKGGGATKTV